LNANEFVFTAPDVWTPLDESPIDWQDEDISEAMRRAGYGHGSYFSGNDDCTVNPCWYRGVT
jgi:hypothetical protein